MPHDRFFVDSPFHAQQCLELREEAKHLKVMRIRPGEVIELVNGRNQLARARLVNPQLVEILSIEGRPSPFPVILCQAIPRLNRFDTIVEKGTELGMTELWLFPGALSEKKNVPLERAKKIAISAMKQCGRLDLPGIKLKPPIFQWDALPYPAYFGDISETAPPFLSVLQKDEGICFIVGPEAGFTPEEENHLKNIGAQGVKLHPWILRTDTAPLAALSLISAYTQIA
jgi:16S rRNA (uracil1498-N3)-methyltransferase